jgi:hypothetical protein
MKIKLCFFLIFITFSCSKSIEKIGDQSISIFKDTHLYFDMALKNDTLQALDSIIRLDAGRVLIKKIKLPKYQLQPKVSVNMTLTSNGDPWDKSGSLFVIPKNSDLTILDFENGRFSLKELEEDYPAVTAFESHNKTYLPNVELLRFMTPFGVGFFNTQEHIKSRKPVYIPEWEDNVLWQKDITHLLNLLEDEVYIGVYIDTWTKEGYNLSVNLNFEESKIPNHMAEEKGVIPLLNTTKYVSDQGYYDNFSKENLSTTFNLTSPIKNAKLYYLTTGHGGHAEGDEFTKKEHIISFNNKTIKQFTPWRDDCASFRRFNPHSGVWTETTTWKGEQIEERIASSDYSRSNWCPGSAIIPEIVNLGDLKTGNHKLEISVPTAQAIDGDKINYWMTSTYIIYDK